MSLYLGDTIVSGVSYPTEPTRNLGQIIESTIPLTDAGLHLLDGALINGSGIYSDFVTKMGELYIANPNAAYFAQNMTWVQPILTSATSYGTVSTDYYYSDSEGAWHAFNGVKGTSDKYYSSSSSAGNIIWQLPSEEINISSCKVYTTNESSYLGRFPQSITIYGSNDGSTWTELGVASGYSQPSSESYVQVNCTATGYYQYIKWEFGSVFNSSQGNVAVSEIEISATVKDSAEANWQSSVTTYGVCGKFVYDSVNNTVRLPKITGIVEGTTDLRALGDLIEAGLPNITGGFSENTTNASQNIVSNMVYGAFTAKENSTLTGVLNVQSITSSLNSGSFYFDASRSSSIYGNSNTVQPQAIKVLYYIVIATTTKTEIEVDIDQVATDLNGKADTDLINVNNSGTSLGAGWAMPSNTYEDLTLGASGSAYIAPANGWFAILGYNGGNNYYVEMKANNVIFSNRSGYSGNDLGLSCPAIKGASMTLRYDGFNSVSYFRFIYAKGSESEAS